MHRGSPARRRPYQRYGTHGASANGNDRFVGPSRPPYHANLYYTGQQANDSDGFAGQNRPPHRQPNTHFRQFSNDFYQHSFGSPRPFSTPTYVGYSARFPRGGQFSPENANNFPRPLAKRRNASVPMDPIPVPSLVIRLSDEHTYDQHHNGHFPY